jgi:hypothetical protein
MEKELNSSTWVTNEKKELLKKISQETIKSTFRPEILNLQRNVSANSVEHELEGHSFTKNLKSMMKLQLNKILKTSEILKRSVSNDEDILEIKVNYINANGNHFEWLIHKSYQMLKIFFVNVFL